VLSSIKLLLELSRIRLRVLPLPPKDLFEEPRDDTESHCEERSDEWKVV